MSDLFESSIIELIGNIWICVHTDNLVAKDSVGKEWTVQICICGGAERMKAGKPTIADRDSVSTFISDFWHVIIVA